MGEKGKETGMGKIYQGVLGGFSGKLGMVVGYTWRGRPCIRVYRHAINYPNTELQQKQRDWFVSMVRFAAQANGALRLGFRQQSLDAQMTEGNYFVMKNKQHFHREEGVVRVDYGQLKIAAGSAADVYFKQPRFEQDETVRVDFEKNSMSLHASGDDSVYLYIYAPGLGAGILSAAATRRSKQVALRLPTAWAGHEVHIYGFVVDKEGRASNSTYIGMGRVSHYEERGRYMPVDSQWQEFVDLAEGSSKTPEPKAATTTADGVGRAKEGDDPPGIP